MSKIIFNALLLLSVAFAQEIHVTHSGPIPLVWQCDRKGFWEEDWLRDILQGVELVNVDDGKYEQFIDNSIVVFSSYHNAAGCTQYFEEMHRRGYTFGIINLSDEIGWGPSTFYPYAAFVFRNYWRSDFNDQKNVVTIPLGYGARFWEGGKQEPVPASDRQYVWSFTGKMHAGQSTRQAMISALEKVSPYFFHETYDWGRNDPRSLTALQYRELMLQTIFVPSPGGWVNMDSFRVYEALECGCIPIVETLPRDYFGNFLPNHPFLTVTSWDEAPALIQSYLADPQALEQKRLECYAWWNEYKQDLNKKLVAMVTQAFSSVSDAPSLQTLPNAYDTLTELLPFNGHGWYSNGEWIEKLIRGNNMKTVVEVGSWLGLSGRHIASVLPEDGKLYCVDTWAGSIEHEDPQWVGMLPTLYEQFLSNVVHAGLTDKIVPLRMRSLDAVDILKTCDKQIDLIYIDAAHDTESVLKDLKAYFPFVSGNRGFVCGDDWAWESVRVAVLEFAQEHALTVYTDNSGFWFLAEEGQYDVRWFIVTPATVWQLPKNQN